ncbi:MAG: efflux transporter, outer rane factor lipoprotein NodT family, partial [Planctomycetaceae bacterium]|nr:efflux transporter, outer rane factor lipoprotein NodT family [Planctomycetaceae bacterium]
MDGISPDPAHGDCAPTAKMSRRGELIAQSTRRSHWTRRAFMASLAVSATGCTTGIKGYINNGFKVGVNFGRPPTAAADHWIDANDARVRSEYGDDSHWWNVFNDPVLNNLV